MDAVSTIGTMGSFNLGWSDGLRIVDIGELSKQMYCKYCKVLLDLSRTERESRFGFASVFFVVCSGCGFTNEICSGKGKANDEGRPVFEINVKAASSMLCHEAGSKYVVSFLATLNIPLPPPGDSVLPGVQSTQDATSQLLISSHASNGTDGSAFSDVPVFSQGSSVTASDRFMFTIPDGFKIENESDNDGADSFEEVNDSHGSLSQAGAKIDNTLGITPASGKKNVRRKRPRKRAPVKRASTNISHTGTKTAAGAKRPRKATAPSASSSVTDASISNLSLSKSGISPTQRQSVPESKKRSKVQAAQSESDHNLVQTASGGGAELSDIDPGAVLEEDWGEAEATKPNVSFMCTVCSALLPSVRGLKVHLARKHQVFNELIGHMGSSQEASEEGMETQPSSHEPILPCQMPVPARSEKVSKSQLCPECGKTFWHTSSFVKHKRLEHNCHGGPFQLCQTSAPTKSKPQSKSHLCPECGMSYCHISSFVKHRRLKHHYLSGPSNVCSVCNKGFSDLNELHSHMNAIHLQIKPHTCDSCKASFCNLRSLQRHLCHVQKIPRTHACPRCEKTFHRKEHVKQHLLTHDTQPQFSCQRCFSKFKHPSNLQRHVKSRCPKREYKALF